MGNRTLFFVTGAVLAAALTGGLVWAQAADKPEDKTPTVDEIVQHTNYVSYYQGADGRAKVTMTIEDARGQKRSRKFTILRWDQPDPKAPKDLKPAEAVADEAKRQFTGEQKFYVYFEEPADVNKMAFLVHKHLDRLDDRWLYLPALDLVKPIAAADKRTSFVGSHFYYEDVSGRNINDDKHELTKTTDTYYVLKNTPKDPDSAEFGHYEMWIHRKTFLVVKTDYYDKDGKKYRTYEAQEVKTIDGFPTVTRSRMSDTKIGGHTLLEYADVKYNAGVPEDVFTERYLRKPPMEWLK